MHNLEIDTDLYEGILEHCTNNKITDVNGYIKDLLYKSFMIDKYGLLKKVDNKLVNIPLSNIIPEINNNIKKEDYENLYNE